MEHRIAINNIDIWQPDKEGLGYAFETTYTEDSVRVQSGVGHFTPMFTVEQLSYSATDVPVAEAAKILQQVAKGQNFTLHYFSLYFNKWMDGTFYVGKGDSNFKSLEIGDEKVKSLSFNMTGVNPI